jgi:short-subunit dehydrogenase
VEQGDPTAARRGPLAGRVVLLTGASSGIGAALAREFAGHGADLVLAARRTDRLAALARDLEATGVRTLACPADVTADGALERVVSEALAAFGRLDVVVANAGFAVMGPLARLTLGDYRRQLETNVFGVLRTVFASLGALRASRGCLVLMGSVSGHVPTPSASAYAMSKFAVRALAGALAAELASDGVGVVLVSPGFVDSEIRRVDNTGALRPEARDPVPRWLVMSADRAARPIVRAVLRRRREVIVTGHGKLAVWLQRLAPGLVAWGLTHGVRPPRGSG